MQTELVALNMTRQEALECLRACLTQSIVENEMRIQQGYEPTDFTGLVRRLITTLGMDDPELEKTANNLSEDLWSYAWYIYTNEWAWFKAEKQARQELGLGEEEKNPELRKRAEKLYKKNFDAYVSEIDMKAKNEKIQKKSGQGPVV